MNRYARRLIPQVDVFTPSADGAGIQRAAAYLNGVTMCGETVTRTEKPAEPIPAIQPEPEKVIENKFVRNYFYPDAFFAAVSDDELRTRTRAGGKAEKIVVDTGALDHNGNRGRFVMVYWNS